MASEPDHPQAVEVVVNEWDEWYRQQMAKQAKPKAPEPKPVAQKEPMPTRPITEDELIKLQRLGRVSTAWWCGDGRFIQQFEQATTETLISERQAWYIRVLWYKYRKQLGHNGPKPEGYK